MNVVLCVAGIKGWQFLEHIAKCATILTVVSYPQKNVIDEAFEKIKQFCAGHSTRLIEATHPSITSLGAFDRCFIVGWQYLLPDLNDRCVIFHDSLLPHYRGYSPTVAALIAGEPRLGVTALLPGSTVDAGPVVAQEAIDITYPITIAEAFNRLAPCYHRIADRLLKTRQPLTSIATAQDESAATYSLWRDEADQRIDWSQDSLKIQRTVDALGWPYTGARSFYEHREVIIHAASPVPDMAFAERQAGKIWRLENGRPVVVCGVGMLRMEKAVYKDGSPAIFDRVRSRFV